MRKQKAYHYIYKITRFDGAFYIGMHSTDDLNDGYFGSGKRLWHSVNYHGKEKHSMEIIEFVQSRKDLIEREKVFVDDGLLQDPKCLNLVPGGGYEHRAPDDPSGAERKSKALKAYYASEAGELTKQKLSEAHTGRKHTAETKKNMGAAAKERMKRMQEDGSWEVVKQKNAAAHHGKMQTTETIEKRNASLAAHKEANGGKRTFSNTARLNISRSLVGSARNVKEWTLVGTAGEEITVENLQQWARDKGFRVIGTRIFNDTRTQYRVKK